MSLIKAPREDLAGIAAAFGGESHSAESFEAMFDDHFVFWHVADNGKRVGFCAARVEGTMFQIGMIGIEPEFREALWKPTVDELAAYGRKNGDRIAYADVDALDSDILALYAKVGFREVSRKEKDAGDGYAFTEVELTRVL